MMGDSNNSYLLLLSCKYGNCHFFLNGFGTGEGPCKNEDLDEGV